VVWEANGPAIDDSFAAALTIRGDHRIIVGGNVATPGEARFAVCRYESDGDLDDTFGYNGSAATGISGGGPASYDSIRALAIDGRGRIVAVGHAGNNAFAVARFLANGRLDNGFNRYGTTATSFGSQASASAVWIDADAETITVGGTAGGQFGIARYQEDGSPDGTFGATTGKIRSVVVPEPSRCEAAALAVDSEGGTVVAGHLVED
jgi:uncharacterized delta-60 repeat protein